LWKLVLFYLYEDTTNTLFYVNNGYNEPILNKKTLTFTTGESGKIYLAALYGNDERFTNLFSNIDIQIEEGSASTEYEQYGVSPSPEFSSEIESVGTYDETSGKYKILVNSTVNLVRYVEMGGAYTTDGTDMPSDTLYRTNYMKVTPNSKLYVYGFDISTTRNVRLFYYDKDKKYISTYLGTNYFDVTTPSNCYYIRANLDKSVVNYQNIVISYSPQDKYGETQALFKIQNGLNSVGDVKDEVDLARGVLIQRVGVIDLGTLNWSVSGSRFQANPLNAKHTDSAWSLANLLCTHYRVDYAQNTWSEVNDKRISINQNGVIHIVDKDYTDATSFKSAMSDVYLIYELATPIEIPLTEDEMAQYRALQTYNPTTVVSATDNALMYVEYYRNTTDGQALANANANNNQNTEALLKKYSDLEQTVDGFKIEVGETVTTNYDELKKNIDDVNTSLNKAIETQQAAISLNADGINQIWSKNYTTKDDVDNIISEQTESVIQRVGKLEGDVSGFKVDITTVQTDVDGLSTNINKHMQFTEDGLILGNSESSFKTQLTETELAFLDGDDKVAYISNKTMNITSAQVEDRFILGNYLYEKTANGLNVKYIRGGV